MIPKRTIIVAWALIIGSLGLTLTRPREARSDLDPKAEFMAAVQAILDAALDQQRANSSTIEERKLQDIARGGAPSIPDPPWDVGIFEGGEAPFPSEEYSFLNMYQGVYDANNYIQIYAGAISSDPNQGVVVMLLSRIDSSDASAQAFRPASATGSLRVMAIAVDELVLKSTNGSYYTLNIRNRTLQPGRPLWYQDP